MFRIISGRWKAKRISAPKNFDVRPTTDFAKEALFSMLENRYDLTECAVLDLFAGIGSITLEFASRYCEDITAVEQQLKHCQFISTTAAELDMALPVQVVRADVFDWLKKNSAKKSYDIIFMDPPFVLEPSKYEELIRLVRTGGYLKTNGLLVVEHQTNRVPNAEGLELTRKYGNVSFSLFPALPVQDIEA